MGCPTALDPLADPDAHKTTRELVLELIPDAEEWLKTPNIAFFGDAPGAWIGTQYEPLLRNRLLNARDGIFS
jgi:hypothetical protein